MKKKSLILLTFALLALPGCDLSLGPNSLDPSPTPTVGPVSTATPTATPTAAVPVPTATPARTGGILSYTGTTVDWGSLNAAEQARWKVQDFDNRRLLVQFNPSDLESGGEFEFTWDKPPADIGVDETFTLNITGKINVVPANGVAGAIGVSFTPAGFFEASPAVSVSQNTGRLSNGSLDQGTKQIRLKAVGFHNKGFDEAYKYSIIISNGLGPNISYNYQFIR